MNHVTQAAPVRARFYPEGDHYTVVVVHDGRHRFYRCDTAADAEALVRLVER